MTRIYTSFEPIEEAWAHLAASAPQASPFLLPGWQRAWWHQWGDEAQLHLFTLEESRELVGLLSLYQRGRKLTLLGSGDLCDYLDGLALSGREELLCARFSDHLASIEWDTLALNPIREDSLLAQRFLPLAQKAGYRVEVVPDEVAPALGLPATWAEYLGTLAKKDRHELRRKQRRLAESGAARFECVESADAAEASLAHFLALMGESRAEKALFLTPERERFFHDAVRAMAEAGALRLWFLEYAGARVAAALAFDVGATRFLYNSGFDRQYTALSAGLLLKARTIEEAIERGLRRYDFLRGSEPYKYDLGGKDASIIAATVSRPGAAPDRPVG